MHNWKLDQTCKFFKMQGLKLWENKENKITYKKLKERKNFNLAFIINIIDFLDNIYIYIYIYIYI